MQCWQLVIFVLDLGYVWDLFSVLFDLTSTGHKSFTFEFFLTFIVQQRASYIITNTCTLLVQCVSKGIAFFFGGQLI